MTTTRLVFRNITLGLQIIALAAFFLPPLFIGGTVSIVWLALGVIHTAIFCAVYFRDSRKRMALSIILTIILALYSAAFLLIAIGFVIPILMNFMTISIFTPLVLYCFASLLSAILAMTIPRKYTAIPPIPNADILRHPLP